MSIRNQIRNAIIAVSSTAMLVTGLAAQEFNTYPISYQRTQQSPSDDSIDEQMEKMSVRMEELEFDVKRKLSDVTLGESKSAKADADFDSRIGALEAIVQTQQKALSTINGELPSLVGSSHGSPRMYLFGRTHLDWWSFPRAQPGINALGGGTDPEDRVELRRLRLGVAGDLNDNMFYRLEAELADDTDSGNYRDVFLGFRNTPLLNTILIGNHKRPYGLDHLNDSNFNTFMERPMIVEAFNEESRRLGISSNGFNENRTVSWRLGVWHQGLTQNRFGFQSDHYQPEVAGRLAFTPWYDDRSGGRGYFHFGVSGSYGWPDGSTAGPDNAQQYRTRAESRHAGRWLDTGRVFGADTNNLVGVETVFNVGAFQLSGEYLTTSVNRDNAVGPNVRFDGGYVQAAYMLTGEHIPWNREWGVMGRVTPFENFFSVRDCDGNVKRGLGAWQVAARYSFADLTDNNIVGGQGDTLTVATNWYWNPNARMQVNYVLGEIDRPALTDAGGEFSAVGMRFMVDF